MLGPCDAAPARSHAQSHAALPGTLAWADCWDSRISHESGPDPPLQWGWDSDGDEGEPILSDSTTDSDAGASDGERTCGLPTALPRRRRCDAAWRAGAPGPVDDAGTCTGDAYAAVIGRAAAPHAAMGALWGCELPEGSATAVGGGPWLGCNN